jgi:hypothetical protein
MFEGDTKTQTRDNQRPFPVSTIEEAVKSIRHGVVQLIIQDGRIVQIDKTEKIRLA